MGLLVEHVTEINGFVRKEMDEQACPICQIVLPLSQLERHVNHHFDEEEQKMDILLAQELAASEESPPATMKNLKIDGISFTAATSGGPRIPKIPTKLCINEEVAQLLSLQTRSRFHRVKDGLITLLGRCLELEANDTISILTGHVEHFQSLMSEDVGWGCGWRNIQMLSSHLLALRRDAREVLFGGSGFVPEIPFLQRWLEIAWEKGFDIAGSEQFNGKIYGSKKWIGTTECAALFCSFGLRARVVDFASKEIISQMLSKASSNLGIQVVQISDGIQIKKGRICGPMDKYLVKGDSDAQVEGSSSHGNSMYPSMTLKGYLSGKAKGQHAFFDWIWNYFSDNKSTKSGKPRVILSNKTPLYFQHDGHSRTIVGIQLKQQLNGMQQANLLVLDPSHDTEVLERSLNENFGWQKLLKRGFHAFRKQAYQLCYIQPGVAHGDELEQLKTIKSELWEI
ncbi:Peptidase C78, ubiquitin fold modifier-specific peptidase 1/ 2 [Dillenia turbinata]|uniref:Peptidase C78, ubiquitin fold modifier-specific peptidase 1/ 2 n=1 Tax=Dillenia turbinata TaxID=194707 RepID=A0AAN8WIJ0_9MAGN